MHPFVRTLVIGAVGLLIAGGLTALAVLGEDSGLSVLAMLGAGLIGTAIGLFVFVQAWRWSQRSYRRGSVGPALGMALAGGLAIVLAAGALAGSIALILLFYL
ncbi:MAG TPA: hypothetical protein VF013_06625 [Candidatus Limnocylindria bacterium]